MEKQFRKIKYLALIMFFVLHNNAYSLSDKLK